MERSPLSLIVVLLALTLATGFVVADENEERVNKTLADPPATGLLVTRVVSGTQAAEAGILAGDVITTYGGRPTPDVPALNLAVKEVAEKQEISVKVVRASGTITFTLRPGRIGVHLIAVAKGKGREPLPPATLTEFDFSPLREGPRDAWYAFYREGARCGIGRITSKLVGESLFVMSKEIIDTGTSLMDHEVTSVATARCGAMPLMTVFRDRMNDWTRYGLWGMNHRRESVWRVATHGAGIEEASSVRRLAPDSIPAYMVETLAGFMPREVGACFRFRALHEGSGEAGLGGALFGVGEETVELGEKKVGAFRYEWRRLEGGLNGIFWVAADGRVLLADYQVVRAVISTEADAVKDQPESIKARLAR